VNKLLLAAVVVVVGPSPRDAHTYIWLYLIVAGEIFRQCDPLPLKKKKHPVKPS